MANDPHLRQDGGGDVDAAAPASAPAPAPAPAARPRARAPGGAFEWLTRRSSLREARASLRDDPERDLLVDRAEAAAEFGDRARENVDRLRRGSSLPLAISLYREAAYWALAAHDREAARPHGGARDGGGPGAEARDLTRAFERAPSELLAAASEGDPGVVREVLVDQSFVDTARHPPERQARDAERAARFVRALIEAADAPRRRVGALLVQRFVRSLTIVVLLGFGAVAASYGVRHWSDGPNLAAGKPWRTSSTYKASDGSTVLRDASGVPFDLLFHTVEESSPWFEIDLGAPTRVSSVKIRNRLDCCQERALPLVVETSLDGNSWKQAKRIQDSFTTLKVAFEPREARYVRLRVDRFSVLHLAKVEVR
jgi:F5/8 type C domain-containing protein